MIRKQATRVNAVDIGIRRIVREQPGIHFRGLGRAANVSSAGQLRHHLDRLARLGVLVEVQDGRYKRFFVAGAHDPKLRPEMARFARVVPRRIAQLLLESPMNRTELRRSLGCADSTLGYHLSRMVLLGDLAKERGQNCCRYSLTSEDVVRKMLLMHGPPDGHRRPDGNPDDNLPNPLRPRPQNPGDMPFPGRAPIPAPAEAGEAGLERLRPTRPAMEGEPTPQETQRQKDFARGATGDRTDDGDGTADRDAADGPDGSVDDGRFDPSDPTDGTFAPDEAR